jgi:hypothetical protein
LLTSILSMMGLVVAIIDVPLPPFNSYIF